MIGGCKRCRPEPALNVTSTPTSAFSSFFLLDSDSAAMDVRSPVHSRHSQFNKRVPKSGPSTLAVRFMEPSPRPVIDNIPKQSSARRTYKSSKVSPLSRPIATNSRIKQDEKYRKDIYLAFVNNALEQKTIVGPISSIL